jgi:hypothetical protein
VLVKGLGCNGVVVGPPAASGLFSPWPPSVGVMLPPAVVAVPNARNLVQASGTPVNDMYIMVHHVTILVGKLQVSTLVADYRFHYASYGTYFTIHPMAVLMGELKGLPPLVCRRRVRTAS